MTVTAPAEHHGVPDPVTASGRLIAGAPARAGRCLGRKRGARAPPPAPAATRARARRFRGKEGFPARARAALRRGVRARRPGRPQPGHASPQAAAPRALPPHPAPAPLAAWRALESREPRPLYVDPLAAALAGPDAVAEVAAQARPFPAGLPPPAEPADAATPAGAGAPAATGAAGGGSSTRRAFCLSNISARVWWFDRQILAALAGAPTPGPGAVGASGGAAGAAAAAPPLRQVVVLGAGLDARPWRLALPKGVAWFEVDLPEVAAAKRAALARAGAATAAAAGAGGGSSGAGGEGPASAAPAAHPLRAASWASVGLDLCRPGAAAALAARGHDAAAPTVWVAEGLLMYLDRGQSDRLLREIAGAGAGREGSGESGAASVPSRAPPASTLPPGPHPAAPPGPLLPPASPEHRRVRAGQRARRPQQHARHRAARGGRRGGRRRRGVGRRRLCALPPRPRADVAQRLAWRGRAGRARRRARRGGVAGPRGRHGASSDRRGDLRARLGPGAARRRVRVRGVAGRGPRPLGGVCRRAQGAVTPGAAPRPAGV
jgi:O-methyltransferase involved in polyketide biosynthesis